MATILREQKAGLSTLVHKPDGGAPDALILLLHGWGSDGDDLMGLAPALAQDFPQAVIAAPDGPAPCSVNPSGRQWFDLGMAKIDEGPVESAPLITGLMEALLDEYALPPERLVLAGFSQGAMMALHVGMRMPHRLAAIIGFSGALLAPGKLEAEKSAAAGEQKVLLVHGEEDEVVPHQALAIAEGMLKAAGVEVTAITREGLGHGIDAEGLKAAVDFMSARLKAN